MDYTIQPAEPVTDEIRRLVRELARDGIDHVDGGMDEHETVHEVRKRCKEARAAARLVRGVLPTYSAENAHFRDTARLVSDIRDATALIETFDDHVRPAVTATTELDDDTLADIRATLVARRDDMTAEMDLDATLEIVRSRLETGIDRADRLPIATDGYDAVAGGLGKSYKRARNRMADAYADPSTEAFHEWRKRIKYHRYHCYMLRNVWPEPMTARRSQLKDLSDITGDEHDLAVFGETMRDEELFDAETRAVLETVITTRRSELRREAHPVGGRLFVEEPAVLVERIRGYWDATREYEHTV